MKSLLLLLATLSVVVIGSEAHIFARFIKRWSYDDHGWDESSHDEWDNPWHTKTKTIVRVKPVIKVKHIVKEIPVYKTVKVYKTIPVYKEVPVVKEVKVIKHIHVHKKEAHEHHVATANKGWDHGGGHGDGHTDQVYYAGEGKVYEATVKDSGSGHHHQWPANAEDRDKIWSEKGWQPKGDHEAPPATHSTGGDYGQTAEQWKVEEGAESGKHWQPPQGWVPPEGWQPPPGWQPPSGWKEWVQKRKSSRKGTVSSAPVSLKKSSG